ncbi:DUF1127 domain-containing protein [Rhizobium sp. AC44/96]|uniref:DUF1127 domain-containing protein n=1 Tax=Rhizobium sp. AC44/96 TaxID=1841654 RepID=UPI001FCD7A44|nr:DUF1127 domain-containing protein [Rhizobium sp. AC44/96]
MTMETAADGRDASRLEMLLKSIRRALKMIANSIEKRRSRAALSELTRDQLDDIGLSPSEARKEAAKSAFWG